MTRLRIDFRSRLGHLAAPLGVAEALPATLAGALSLAVYGYTLAPSVTFKDSGELIVAALQWGVPHPTGYPLWTLLAGLFSLLPLGPGAWEVNLFSAVCAALATGLVAALMHHMGRAAGAARGVTVAVSVGVALAFAFSVSVWSQAVFAEVYTLHILLAAVFWWALYRWFLSPADLRGFLLCVFVLALGMSNHHLMLALAPLPFLLAYRLRRDVVWELIAWSSAAGALFYLGFAALADQALTRETAMRSGQLVLLVLVALFLLRGRPRHWRLGLALVPTIALGLLPYAYMPTASSTNPPMNWGYTRTADGFYYSVNRSPYRGPLSDQLLGTLGRLVSTHPATLPISGEAQTLDDVSSDEASALGLLGRFAGRYVLESSRSFTVLAWPLLLVLVWRARGDPTHRPWLVVLGAGFALSALFQPASAAFAGAAARLEWSLQMPYLGYSYIPLALLLGLALLAAHGALRRHGRLAGMLVLVAALALPVVGFTRNERECSQRGRWYAWRFGHDMLASLPRGAVLFGGSDAGRFVPTYMIFGESVEKPRHKRDPAFDRRDVYLITQTQLLARFYRSYIRDHYGAERPAPGALGRLLGRDEAYPEKPLQLPSENDVALLIRAIDTRGGSIDELPSDVAHWIYRANRDAHEFFVEDSLDMPWTRPLAIPAGPVYRLARVPRPPTDDEIAADHAYWRATLDRLLADPEFEHDLDARLAIMALRHQGARVYRDRGLLADAEHAFRQALEILPNELRSMLALGQLLASQGRFGEAREVVAEVLGEASVIDRIDRRWLERQVDVERRTAIYTQMFLDPGDNRVIGELLTARGAESLGSARALDLAVDLKTLQRSPEATVPLRRVLGVLRAEEAHALADHLARRRLEEQPSLRLVQLLVADQRMQPVRLTEEGRAVRLALAESLVGVGECDLALDLVHGLERDDEMLRIREAARRLQATQAALEPVLDGWSRGRGQLSDGGDDPTGLAARLGGLGRALAAFQGAPDPPRLVEAVNAARQLRLPQVARDLLGEQVAPAVPADRLLVAVRLAARDVRPDLLLPLADRLEAVAPGPVTVWQAVASLRHAANDQAGMQRAINEIERRVGRDGVVAAFRRDPLLAPLADDPRFWRFLFGAPSETSGGPVAAGIAGGSS
ncbi:MAG: DUF2723 domain-containing protein [Acidobacteriota bacterium]